MALNATQAAALLDNYVNAAISGTATTVRGNDPTDSYTTSLATARTNVLNVLVNSTSPTYNATTAAAALDAYAKAKISEATYQSRGIETDGTSTVDATLTTKRSALLTALQSAP